MVWSPKKYSMLGMLDEHLIWHPVGSHMAPSRHCRCHFELCFMWTVSCLVPSHQVAQLAKALQEAQKVRSMFWTCQGKKASGPGVYRKLTKDNLVSKHMSFTVLETSFFLVSYWNLKETKSVMQQMQSAQSPPASPGMGESGTSTRRTGTMDNHSRKRHCPSEEYVISW